MKPAALEFLVCPICKASLDLNADACDGAEIIEGRLFCTACRAQYPILKGVPRFVSVDAYASSFGFQWNRYRTVQLNSANGNNESAGTVATVAGWDGTDYYGRLVLDAGVGAGRFAEVVERHGGRVVGIDLTYAVDAAYHNIGRQPLV